MTGCRGSIGGLSAAPRSSAPSKSGFEKTLSAMLRDFATLHDVGVSTGMPATASLLPPPFSERFSAHCATRPERLALQSHALLARVGLHDIPTSAGALPFAPARVTHRDVLDIGRALHRGCAVLGVDLQVRLGSAASAFCVPRRAVPCRTVPRTIGRAWLCDGRPPCPWTALTGQRQRGAEASLRGVHVLLRAERPDVHTDGRRIWCVHPTELRPPAPARLGGRTYPIGRNEALALW